MRLFLFSTRWIIGLTIRYRSDLPDVSDVSDVPDVSDVADVPDWSPPGRPGDSEGFSAVSVALVSKKMRTFA